DRDRAGQCVGGQQPGEVEQVAVLERGDRGQGFGSRRLPGGQLRGGGLQLGPGAQQADAIHISPCSWVRVQPVGDGADASTVPAAATSAATTSAAATPVAAASAAAASAAAAS